MIEVKELSVVRTGWDIRIHNARDGRRGRPPDVTIARWIARWARRTRDTVTGDPWIDVSDDHADYFIRNQRLLRIRIPRLVGGQDYGLPAVLMTDAKVLSFETIDGRYVSRAEMWDRGLTTETLAATMPRN